MSEEGGGAAVVSVDGGSVDVEVFMLPPPVAVKLTVIVWFLDTLLKVYEVTAPTLFPSTSTS